MNINIFTPNVKKESNVQNHGHPAFGTKFAMNYSDLAKDTFHKSLYCTEDEFLNIVGESKLMDLYENIMDKFGYIIAKRATKQKLAQRDLHHGSYQYPLDIKNASAENKVLFHLHTSTRKVPNNPVNDIDYMDVDFTDEFKEIFSAIQESGFNLQKIKENVIPVLKKHLLIKPQSETNETFEKIT